VAKVVEKVAAKVVAKVRGVGGAVDEAEMETVL
jgi:hypothetical protein